MLHELALVMPVYNEEACIENVVRAWHDELDRLGINFLMIVLNDGSRDSTGLRLEVFSGSDRIMVVNKKNSGHGPTILQGYRLAAEDAEWVFQTDSDDEMSPEHFAKLWDHRHDYDAMFGVRHGRKQGMGRWLISAVSRWTVNLLYGSGVADVNTPYRLMRAACLKGIIHDIPYDTFAPNVIIAGALTASGKRILNVPVPHRDRMTGTVSIVKFRLWKAAARSLLQTVCLSGRFGRFSRA